ncbi:MAG: DUF1415 domain-containing protein [Gammaproteobacteria bacterium]
MAPHSNDPLADTRRWVETVVVGHNLCPFAARPQRDDKIRYALSAATCDDELIVDLGTEISRLLADDVMETTLLVHPQTLQDFPSYNQFLNTADTVLEKLGVSERLQVASFHPDYCFADSPADDQANYTNRSPYPMLHLLREDTITRAVQRHGDPDAIPERNVEYLRGLSREQFDAQFVKPVATP